MAQLFGFQITRTKDEGEQPTFVLPDPEDGATTSAGFYSEFIDIEGQTKSESDLIRRYRSTSEHPECDLAIEDIVNESINTDELKASVSLNTDNLPYSSKIKARVREEFQQVLNLLDFNNKAHDVFRRWYIDGRLHYHKIIDEDDPQKGIQELRYIDALKIKRVRKVDKDITKKGSPTIKVLEDYYVYNEGGAITSSTQSAIGGTLKITADAIAHCPSGLFDPSKALVRSYLHKAIKPVNQLRMIEDAVVIYRIARAPERRIFYIDVGNLPKIKAEQYLRDIMNKYKNKLVYDSNSGEVKDERKHMSMLEDYWLPRREGGRGTEISTLPGGENLGELADVDYFKTKLYKALNVPPSRLEQDSGFILGRAEEISRDEVKFTRFIERLRSRFNILFDDLLEKQLLLKGIVSSQDWMIVKDQLIYEWQTDSHFAELQQATMMRERLGMLVNDMGYRDAVVGKYFSQEYVNKHILKLTQEEIDQMKDQKEKEKAEAPKEGAEDQQWEFDPSANKPDLKVISG